MKLFNNKRWAFLSTMFLSGIVGAYRRNIVEFAKVKSTAYYLRAVQHTRGAIILVLQILFCMVLFIVGLVLVHGAVFFSLTEGFTLRVWSLLGLGAAESGVSILFIRWFLSSKRWLKAALDINPPAAKVTQRQYEYVKKRKAKKSES